MQTVEMQTIEREELKVKLERGDDFRLVLALPPQAYRDAHIPGSLNFDSTEASFATLSPEEDIVVYCSDAPCVSSQFAYRQLVQHGYRHVRRYAGGLADWAAAGYPLEGERV